MYERIFDAIKAMAPPDVRLLVVDSIAAGVRSVNELDVLAGVSAVELDVYFAWCSGVLRLAVLPQVSKYTARRKFKSMFERIKDLAHPTALARSKCSSQE